MKAYTPPDLNAKIDKATKDDWESAQKKITEREAARKLAPLFRRLGFFYETNLYTFNPEPLLEIYVDKMQDCEPALLLIEDELNVTFSHTYDNPVSLERQFSAEGMGFRLDVRIRPDSPHCKSVIVGYESVPKYEIRCDDAATPAEDAVLVADEKGIDDDLPF